MQKQLFALLALALSLPVAAEPISVNAFNACAALSPNDARLACYDQLAKDHAKISEHADTAHGKWEVDIKVDPIDDSKTVHIALTADSGNSRYGKPIQLLANCDSDQTELLIDWQIYLGSEAKVTLRIGDHPAHTTKWKLSSNRQQSFNTAPIETLKTMLQAEQMAAQTTPFNQQPSTAIFDLRGLDEAIKPLRAACNW
ncbi:type VI secretion system-associated protein TagO [Oceanisphaera avium]|uniref:type VI secretion system-associated protein TagO n=1 Tax=Oceanisphaera avium TaxID=1903694 RepID=UPI0012F8181C|nr:type VI secretion system-associated protein TagO [Oceanisphaera avium]